MDYILINVEACCTHANESDTDENVDQLYFSLDVGSDANGSRSNEEISSNESDRNVGILDPDNSWDSIYLFLDPACTSYLILGSYFPTWDFNYNCTTDNPAYSTWDTDFPTQDLN